MKNYSKKACFKCEQLENNTRDPRRTSIGILRPHRPPQDRIHDNNKNDSLDKSLSLLHPLQLSQLPAAQNLAHLGKS